jgi:hypothetical protein
MLRKIIHLDLDAFFCAVEQLKKPELKGIPFAVGGRPEERGVVASCSRSRVHGVSLPCLWLSYSFVQPLLFFQVITKNIGSFHNM